MELFDLEHEFNLNRIAELEKLILKYQKSYYNGEGEISDAEFDKLWDELKDLDPANPILHKVGQDSGNFQKAPHVMPMGSQEKAADPEQFLAWAQKHTYSEYLVEYKLDGASLELQYNEGSLVRAVTRGDGSTGDVITDNAVKMQGVIKSLKINNQTEKFTGGIRGEVIMTHEVHKKYYSDKANCRNAANGLMKRKDGEGSEHLCLIVYDVWATQGEQPFSDEEEKLTWLTSCGFNVVPLKICKSASEVIEYRSSVMEFRKGLDYDIDGLVIKERAVNHEDASRDRPDRQIAFKFSLEEAVSVVRDVEWNENGATYTPVAVFDPVDLNGTTVQRASLANPNNIRSLGLMIGSHVVVVKRGEIIPKIEAVLKNDGSAVTSPVSYPVKCSSCGSQLVDEGSRLYCPSKSCPKKVLHQLLKWVSVCDIRDLGETLVTQLFNTGLVKSITDIYSLDEEKLTPYFLNEDSISQDKKSLGAKKVAASIQSHRKITLARFIAGFDIENIGETVVEKLMDAGYSTLEKILSASPEDIEKVYGFAGIMAATLCSGLEECREEMRSLVSSGTISLEEGDKSGSLAGLSFCFTGELHSMKRTDAQNLVKENGGSVKSSVVKGLSYLVTNDTSSGSSKNVKAASLGIPVISEEEFLTLVNK
ncbi:NAD-dependent DNA ligase LigA [Treponema sp.]|uniref:NAD-dependent DNA ligase LigA n=1 Tax=Treponema sp. TaxID=166 RepID=UPI0025DE591B|nr:NAD-dependent DNA ligase LigA [Treponema sp.]MCR5218755.1 NAD-dependent DNA ligase LigA [Treponema sp.]